MNTSSHHDAALASRWQACDGTRLAVHWTPIFGPARATLADSGGGPMDGTRRAVTSLGGVTPDLGPACLEHLPGEAGTPTRHQPPLRLVRREERELEESWSQKECTEGTPVGDRVLKQMTEQARVANT